MRGKAGVAGIARKSGKARKAGKAWITNIAKMARKAKCFMACKLYLITPPQFVLDDFISQLKDVIEENNKQGKPIAALQVRCKIKTNKTSKKQLTKHSPKKLLLQSPLC